MYIVIVLYVRKLEILRSTGVIALLSLYQERMGNSSLIAAPTGEIAWRLGENGLLKIYSLPMLTLIISAAYLNGQMLVDG
ncbi:hypothetical protein D3C75_918130 [compost metagenome]